MQNHFRHSTETFPCAAESKLVYLQIVEGRESGDWRIEVELAEF